MKKKKILKILTAVMILTLMTISFAVTAYAANVEEEMISSAADTAHPEIADEVSAPDNTEPNSSEGEESIFSLMYSTVMNYSSEIFCALACGCSLLIVFAYKKGLLPLIKAALGALTSSVSKLKEQTEAHLDGSDSALSMVKNTLVTYEAKAQALTEKLSEMDEKLTALEKNGSRAKATEYIMNTQIDMLYELFMASGIPQFQKEAVAERVKIMKEAIRTNEDGKEST